MWYYATFLYFGNYYRKDPRERAGLAASAILVCDCFEFFLFFDKEKDPTGPVPL